MKDKSRGPQPSGFSEVVISVDGAKDVISLTALEEVFRSSSDPHIRESAGRVLLDRAMGEKFRRFLAKCCHDEKNSVNQRRAVCVLQQLSKHEHNRISLVRGGFLKLLTGVIMKPVDEATARHSVTALYRLVQGNDGRKAKIAQYGALAPLKLFLTKTSTCSTELTHWSLFLTHQLALNELIQMRMVESGYLPTLATLTRLTFGNANMQKLCLHSMVRLLSKINGEDLHDHLKSLKPSNLIPLLVTCLRSDDAELASWSVFLIHEFVTRDIGRAHLVASKGLLASFANLLSSTEQCIPRLVLRSLKYLAMRNDAYQLEMIKNGIVAKAVPCLHARDDSDADGQMWALALLHDLLAHAEAHAQFLDAKGLSQLTSIPESSVHLSLYIADIIVYLASRPSNREVLEASGVEATVMAFCESTEPDLQYAGCALLLNIATLSEYLRQQVLDQFAVERLTELILQSDQENVQTVAAKALLTLVRKDTLLGDYVVATTIVPLTSLIVDLEAQIMRSLYGPLKEDMADLSQRQLFERITAHLVSFALLIDPRIMHLPADRSMDALLGCTVDFLTLPLMDHPFAPAEMRALSEVDAMSRQIRRRTSLRLGESGVSNRETSFSSLKEEIAIHALRLMMKYFTNPYAIDFVVRENVLTLVTAALDVHAVQEQAMITLSAASEIPALRTALLAVPFLWRGIDRVQKVSASHFPLTVFYENVCHFCDPATRGLVSDRYALFEKSEATPNLRISPQGFQLCNDSWTFESVRTKPAVSKSGRYAYEIVLKTDGIIQLGWASNHDDWDPEAGTGVGDDEHSYAVDGHRCKKWHGSAIENNNYGKAWSIGDVITALIDLDRKQLEYLHNGVSLGIAFSGIEDVPWHPAISLATGQACGARFGHRLDPLQYTPAGYEPFAVMLDKDLDIIPASTPSPNSRKVDFSTNTVPSARFPPYQFVARIGLGGLAEGCIPQMGVIDSRKTIVFLALGPDGRNAVVQAENIDPSDHTFFGALLLEKLVQTPDQETGLTVLASWPSEKADRLVEGDLLACIVDNARGEIRFTRNGSSYGPPVPSSLSEPLYSSYLRHVPRFLINLDVAPVNSGRIFA